MLSDVRICAVEYRTEEYLYRTPIKFGGVAVDRATLLHVALTVETVGGVVAVGHGSMPLGNVWAFPSRRLGYAETLGAMLALAERLRRLYADCPVVGHPIDFTHTLEPAFFRAATDVSAERHLADPIPALAALVVASPFDAALHDAFGHVHRRSCYATYGRDLLPNDLDHYLGAEFEGRHLSEFIRTTPVRSLPLYHLVGALDPLTPAEVRQPVADGHPEHLAEWIWFNGLTHLKIKLNGDDSAWDVNRVLAIEQVTAAAQAERGVTAWYYSLDFNERCPNVAYLLAVLEQLRTRAPRVLARIQYIEQPTARDLTALPANPMHAAAAVVPVVVDESLLGRESLEQARALGYSGAALKACKGQTQSLLLAAAAQHYGLFLCVQDLTCPGAALVHSAGLAAHVPGVAALEANARQYLPAANAAWLRTHPGLFQVTDGRVRTTELGGVGLSLRGRAEG
jgi:L-alanine-DL-glutamate epimerase-like enolase superfamily enzyme